MPTTFPTVLNNVSTTLGAPYASGASLTLAAGYGATLAAALAAEGQPALSPTNWLRVTVDNGAARAVFKATARSGDVLTVTLIEGAVPSGGFARGVAVQGRWTSAAAREVFAAVNALEAAPAASLDGLSDVVLSGPQNRELLQYDSGASRWANSSELPDRVLEAESDLLALSNDFAAHNHDSRYYTKSQIDSSLTGLGSGTVTSVGLTAPAGLSVSGSPVTSAGTLAVTLSVSGLLKGSGGAFVAAVAGTDYAAASHVHSASDVTSGILDGARGGTGQSSLAAGCVTVGAGSSGISASNMTYSGTTLSLGLASGGDGYLYSTSHATKGKQYLNSTTTVVNASGYLGVGTASPTWQVDVLCATDLPGIRIKGSSSQTLDLFGIVDGSNNAQFYCPVISATDYRFLFGVAPNAPTFSASNAKLQAFPQSSSGTALNVQGKTGQTGDLATFRDASGAVMTAVGPAGAVHGGDASGTNVAGTALVLAGGKATGNAAGGSVKLQASAVGSSGATVQTLATVVEAFADGHVTLGATGGCGVDVNGYLLAGGPTNAKRLYLNTSTYLTSSGGAEVAMYVGASLVASFNGSTPTIAGAVSFEGITIQPSTAVDAESHLKTGLYFWRTRNYRTGAAPYDNAWQLVNTSGSNAVPLSVTTANSVAAGIGALATNATAGFLYVPKCAGTPTGTPTDLTGFGPIVIDSTNHKLYFYSGGAWRDAGP